MRIAYITTYQGPSLLERRPVLRNRSLSNAVKIELIASLLRANSHDVEVISQGEVVDQQFKFYPSFSESKRFDSAIPVHYASALPIRLLNAQWSSEQTLRLFKSRHRFAPFDLVIIFNLKEPQVACASYAIKRLGLPVILEYEDDRFTDVGGEPAAGLISGYRDRRCKRLMQVLSGCIAVSPHLLSQIPERTPKMLLRGVVADDIVAAVQRDRKSKRNWILFSGTHVESNGIAQLIEAWRTAPVSGWELHITGYGQLTDLLKEKARGVPGLTFHGLVSRPELIELLSSANICINPYTASKTPGNLFAFKVIEYLAAGAHCVTTPMGTLEPGLQAGITYMPDNSPETIAATLKRVIDDRSYERRAAEAAQETYGLAAVAKSLDGFLNTLKVPAAESRVIHQVERLSGGRGTHAARDGSAIAAMPSPEKPLVSILIPAYNAQRWISHTLRSAIAQTWPRKEIIVLDDGSTDRTLEVAQRFASQGIRVVSSAHQGAAAARNRAMELSRGDYIQWLDADDLLAPDKIERQLAALQEGESKRILLSSPWAHFYYRTSDAHFVPTRHWQDLCPVEWLVRKMGENLHMQTSTWLVSRELAEAAGPWNTQLTVDDDGEYFCRVLLASEGTRFVPESKVFYRRSSQNRLSFVGNCDAKKNSLFLSIKLHIAYLRSQEDSERVRKACLACLACSYWTFYPERLDIVAELQSMAAELGGHLEVPHLRGKYAWIRPMFGWKAAKWAQSVLPQWKITMERGWDEALYRLEDREKAADGATHTPTIATKG